MVMDVYAVHDTLQYAIINMDCEIFMFDQNHDESPRRSETGTATARRREVAYDAMP